MPKWGAHATTHCQGLQASGLHLGHQTWDSKQMQPNSAKAQSAQHGHINGCAAMAFTLLYA